MTERTYSINDVMRIFKVGRQTVKKWIADKSIDAKSRPARNGIVEYYISEKALDDFENGYEDFCGMKGYAKINDVAEIFGVNKLTVKQWIIRGWLKAETNGADGTLIRYKIKNEEIDAFRNGAYKKRWSALKDKHKKREGNEK